MQNSAPANWFSIATGAICCVLVAAAVLLLLALLFVNLHKAWEKSHKTIEDEKEGPP
jgi:hypothetical protein